MVFSLRARSSWWRTRHYKTWQGGDLDARLDPTTHMRKHSTEPEGSNPHKRSHDVWVKELDVTTLEDNLVDRDSTRSSPAELDGNQPQGVPGESGSTFSGAAVGRSHESGAVCSPEPSPAEQDGSRARSTRGSHIFWCYSRLEEAFSHCARQAVQRALRVSC